MTVLPTIDHTPRLLQPRTATGNELSVGAIAGIVIGCIVGVLLLLTIFWTCLLGSHIFTKAKNLSTSVVDKAEKGHARAKDLYTAGREQGRQPSETQDAAHYGELQFEDQSPLANYCFAESEPPVDFRVSNPFSIIELPAARQEQKEYIERGYSSTVDKKPVVVDAKRILGTDDASYLDEITSHGRKAPWLTAAPAGVASGSKTPFLGTGDSHETLQSSERSKAWLQDFRPDRSTYNHCPPESTSAELHPPQSDGEDTVDYFAFSRPRRSRAIVTKNTEGEVTEQSTFRRCDLDKHVCVNPWDVEHQPNPVIFSHLSSSVKTTPKQNVDHGTACAPNSKMLSTSEDCIGMSRSNAIRLHDPPAPCATPTTLDPGGTLLTLHPIMTESSDDTVHSLGSSTSELSVESISPVTATSGEFSPFKGKERCLDKLGTVEFINFAAIIPATQPSSSLDNDIAIASSLSSHTWTDSGAINLPSQASPLSSPPSVSTPAKALVSPSVSTEMSTDTAFPCPLCHLSFRTPGLRRNHQNRKHNLRYPCTVCNSRFGLRADLQRHENNVHRYDTHAIPAKLFRCPNIDCTTPGKTYARKDNFKRHVQRCEKTIGIANATRN
ncbi:hypothetical protein BKA58DRAFT_224489 [Alternaria rosae]|uniref:uncharacterized protein n=1 Tax=Alternaria rosae TaxID=1187941 RepID=UPI001E8E935E|nr:uncharacterized protein BKA58DRAFT_224489 [Alternaria rosae]KAH6865594.1 hypothetical protein BKA58DRAFT_224489 [Alternaria rosae]